MKIDSHDIKVEIDDDTVDVYHRDKVIYSISEKYEQWWDYDDDSNEIHYKDSAGVESWTEYDSNGNKTQYRTSDGFTYWYTDNITRFTTPAGGETVIRYDEYGNEILNAETASNGDYEEIRREYDPYGKVTHYTRIDSDGESHEFYYAANGDQISKCEFDRGIKLQHDGMVLIWNHKHKKFVSIHASTLLNNITAEGGSRCWQALLEAHSNGMSLDYAAKLARMLKSCGNEISKQALMSMGGVRMKNMRTPCTLEDAAKYAGCWYSM